VRQRRHLGREELGHHDPIAGECCGGQCHRVQPTQRRILDGAVIEIESINVEDGSQVNRLPGKNAGAAPEGAAPRPVAEASRRDVGDEYTR